MDLSTKIEVINTSTDLNFYINSFDEYMIENIILMDFMETFDVADIFIIQAEGI